MVSIAFANWTHGVYISILNTLCLLYWIYHNCHLGYGTIAVSFSSSRYHVDESDGSLKVILVASKQPKFAFYVRLDVVLNLRIKGSLGMNYTYECMCLFASNMFVSYKVVTCLYAIIIWIMYYYHIIIIYCVASREDVVAKPVYVKFNKFQQKAVGTIKIFSDDIVEGTEYFAVKMTLPLLGLYKRLLKYGYYRYTLVYIKDCKLTMYMHNIEHNHCNALRIKYNRRTYL